MAEVEKTNPALAGEMMHRFVQFVMIHTQNILYLLGRIPGPDGEGLPPNLEAAKMLIDQLEMIQEKTKGNLASQEIQILENALTNVRLAFVEASGGTPASMMPETRMPGVAEEMGKVAPSSHPEPAPAAARQPEPKSAPAEDSGENKKKFSKTYG